MIDNGVADCVKNGAGVEASSLWISLWAAESGHATTEKVLGNFSPTKLGIVEQVREIAEVQGSDVASIGEHCLLHGGGEDGTPHNGPFLYYQALLGHLEVLCITSTEGGTHIVVTEEFSISLMSNIRM